MNNYVTVILYRKRTEHWTSKIKKKYYYCHFLSKIHKKYCASEYTDVPYPVTVMEVKHVNLVIKLIRYAMALP